MGKSEKKSKKKHKTKRKELKQKHKEKVKKSKKHSKSRQAKEDTPPPKIDVPNEDSSSEEDFAIPIGR